MDLIGKFKRSTQGLHNALTVINMVTNYTCCIPLFIKEVVEVVHAYLVHVYYKFGGSHMILSDSDTEF